MEEEFERAIESLESKHEREFSKLEARQEYELSELSDRHDRELEDFESQYADLKIPSRGDDKEVSNPPQQSHNSNTKSSRK